MKPVTFFLWITGLFASVPALADAGFSITRKTAPSELTFEGTASLGSYKLLLGVYTHTQGYGISDEPEITRRDTVNDGTKLIVQDGWRRWDERFRDLRLWLVDSSGKATDSLPVYMKKYNYHYIITGVKDGKLQYRVKRSKAVYEYTALDKNEEGNHRLIRWVFIGCSLLGFAGLTWLFLKRKNVQPA